MAVRKTDSGTWAVSFYYDDWNGERVRHRKAGFQTKREAQSYEHDFLANHSNSPKMTFGELVTLYMEDCKSRIRVTTYATKKNVIQTKILPYFKNVTLDTITPAMIRKWQTLLINDPLQYSDTYLKIIHGQLSAILNFAVKYYGLSSNPAAKCGSIGKGNADSMNFWTRDEFERFESSVSDKLSSKAMFDLLYWTGMRSGELLALSLSDFDFAGNTVSISKTYTRLNGQDIINAPKTPAGKRIVTVPASVIATVQEYAHKLSDVPSERFFPFSRKHLKREMIRGCKASGLQRIRIHDLRHSHASLLIEMGYSPLLIAERLGHENIQTTLQTYSHLYPNKQEQLALELEKIIQNKGK